MNRVLKKRPRNILPRGRIAVLFVLILPALPLVGLHAQHQQSSPAKEPQHQSQPEPPTAPTKITTETSVVTVFTSVRDKKGRILSDLTKNDFALDEDGKPQAITYFAREDQLPLTVGLLVDTSLSQRTVLADERTASATFIDQTLREEMKDKAFLIHFDHEVELLQDLTSSRQKLDSALNLLQIAQRDDGSAGQRPDQDPDQQNGRRGRYGRGGGTHLYDAIFLASDELMKKQQGRKALIVLSDGVDRGSKETLSSSIEAAQRANTIVYSILFKGEEPSENFGRRRGGWGMGGPGMGYPPMGGQRRYPQGREERPDGKTILARISKETGGRLFEVSKKQPVDKIYTQITQELRDQYVLGYAPPKSDEAGYHKIHVTTNNKDSIVQARDGYYWNPAAARGQ
jgi:VWFA-related protein